MLLDKHDNYSFFRVKFNNNMKNRNLETKKRCFNTLKMLSYNRKLWYRLRNSMKFTTHIQMIQGTAISLSCDLKKNPLKKCYSSSQITEARRYDCQWLPWILDTPSTRHTQETNSVRTVMDQQGEQTIKKDAKASVMWMVSWSHSTVWKNYFFVCQFLMAVSVYNTLLFLSYERAG